jgi:hypothetical protein
MTAAPPPKPPPGWYPDPSGGSQRYWDGNRWTATAPQPQTASKASSRTGIGTVLGVVVVGIALAAMCSHHSGSSSTSSSTASSATAAASPAPASPTYSEDEIVNSVIDTCQGSVKKQLRDPDSAKFDSWKAWQVTAPGSKPPAGMTYNPAAGDKYYSAGGMVNAKNGFGGYAGGEPYACDAIVTTGGDVNARANSLAGVLGSGN